MQDPEKVLRKMKAPTEEAEEALDEISPVTTLSIDVTDTRGRRYRGDFVFKVPTLGEQIQIGRLKNEFLPNGAASDPNSLALNEQICFLQVTIQKKPDWWKPFQFYDATPVSALYGEALKYERTFHSGHAGDRSTAPDTEGAEVADADGTADQADVGRKVPAPPKRRETLVAHSSGGG
jgi:hypothetical protein